MVGKATVSGEQGKGFQRGEIPVIGFNMALTGTYRIREETLQDWKDYTQSLFGNSGMDALSQLEKAGAFRVKFKGHNSVFYITNVFTDNAVVGITEEELNKFCIKL